MKRFLTPWAPQLLSVFRIMYGLLFLEHGMSKILGFPPPAHPRHLVLFSLGGASGLIELIGGFLLTIGLFSRCAAFVMSGEMAFAYFLSHAPRGFFPLLNDGEEAIMYCFAFLYLAAAGGGPWSLDAYFGRSKSRRSS